MEEVLKRDVKSSWLLLLSYLILQYLAIFLLTNVDKIVINNTNVIVEYFGYFIMIISVIYLVLGSLLLFFYMVIKPAIKDKEQKYKLSEGIILYRFLGLITIVFIGFLNLMIALSVISEFDISILFQQKIYVYIGLSFVIEVILSIILIIYNKIYNGKPFVNKLNIFVNIMTLLIIYVAGNLYYLHYFMYGMVLLLVGYLLLFINIKLVVNKIGTKILYKILWTTLCLILIVLIALSFVKGENDATYKTNEQRQEELSTGKETFTYSLFEQNALNGVKYISDGFIQYVFEYEDKNYIYTKYEESKETNVESRGINSLDYAYIYETENGYYIDSKVKEKTFENHETYLTCSGSFTYEELQSTECLDRGTKEVLQYLKDLE